MDSYKKTVKKDDAKTSYPFFLAQCAEFSALCWVEKVQPSGGPGVHSCWGAGTAGLATEDSLAVPGNTGGAEDDQPQTQGQPGGAG